ncbi:M15 family metallopeptidase [Marinibactrum halimedae]|nr:M15 family metallopeptidase [Marinibactrum halimedae]MCD9458982.1 M15 family metallopeptidase [Marinibactrum halimedae]
MNKAKINVTPDMLFGATEVHLSPISFCQENVLLNSSLEQPLQALFKAGKEQGFEIRVASGFRSAKRQLHIWNKKARGERPVLDQNEVPMSCPELPEWSWVEAILRWSALPGTSRHHWGTDVDIYAPNVLPKGYTLQLTYEETQPSGVMGEFYLWLDEWLSAQAEDGFFRPFMNVNNNKDNFGVACEPWHLSYKPVARVFERAWDEQARSNHKFKGWLLEQDIELKSVIIENLDQIFARFVHLPLASKKSE